MLKRIGDLGSRQQTRGFNRFVCYRAVDPDAGEQRCSLLACGSFSSNHARLRHMRMVAILTGCGLALMNFAAGQTAPRRPPQPDVYLVTIDTLRVDHVHCYGYERIQTPTLDGLAEHGIRFAQAYSPSPITNTSHTSILTGLMPSAHGVTDFARPLVPTHPTWAEVLKKNGYQTAAFIGCPSSKPGALG